MFTTLHIALTALLTGVLAAAGALLVCRRRAAVPESLLIGLLAGVAVFLWRRSANLPALNDDGMPPFSANDWLAPVIVAVMLGLWAVIRRPGRERRFAQACAAAVVVAFAVNVITI